MYANFLLGSLKATEGVLAKLKRLPLDMVARHAVNDHGRITDRERRKNQLAMKTINTIVSRYPVDPTDPEQGFVLVITDSEWQSTLIKLENEECS